MENSWNWFMQLLWSCFHGKIVKSSLTTLLEFDFARKCVRISQTTFSLKLLSRKNREIEFWNFDFMENSWNWFMQLLWSCFHGKIVKSRLTTLLEFDFARKCVIRRISQITFCLKLLSRKNREIEFWNFHWIWFYGKMRKNKSNNYLFEVTFTEKFVKLSNVS